MFAELTLLDHAACVCFYFNPKGSLEPDLSVKATHQPLQSSQTAHADIFLLKFEMKRIFQASLDTMQELSSVLYSVHSAGRETSLSSSHSSSLVPLSWEVLIKPQDTF